MGKTNELERKSETKGQDFQGLNNDDKYILTILRDFVADQRKTQNPATDQMNSNC